jgi:hypothetical protein
VITLLYLVGICLPLREESTPRSLREGNTGDQHREGVSTSKPRRCSEQPEVHDTGLQQLCDYAVNPGNTSSGEESGIRTEPDFNALGELCFEVITSGYQH